MKVIKYICLFLVFGFLSFSQVHKYYVSITKIDYVKEKAAVQITSRLFIDDFEALLKERYNENVVLDTNAENSETINNYIKAYFKSKLAIQINGETKGLNYIGIEFENDLIYCYLEIPNIEFINTFEVSNKVLFDLFTEQKNIVRTTINGTPKSFILIPENDKGLLKF